jgi:MSHA pilin protein MshA
MPDLRCQPARGFTFVEIVVVIAIVAVATALVLPHVGQWQRAARVGHLTAARGAVLAAATLVHAKTLARGGVPDAQRCVGGGGTADNRLEGPGTVCTETGLVQTMHGHPASLVPGAGPRPGILGAAGLAGAFNVHPGDLRRQGFEVTVEGPVTLVVRSDAPDPRQCRFTYTEPPAPQAVAIVSPVVDTGC